MANFSDITEHLSLNRRECARCGARLMRNHREILSAWRRRKYCSKSCAAQHSHTRDPRERFEECVSRAVGQGPQGDCHEWQKGLTSAGYGSFLLGDIGLAHRAAFLLHHGYLPADKMVCHKCDNPRCVNVAHLFLGGQSANMADMARKGRGRSAVGSRHYNSRLTDAQREAIRNDDRPGPEIAREYGISKTHVNLLKRGKRGVEGSRRGEA